MQRAGETSLVFDLSKPPGYLQVNVIPCGPTVSNHLFLLNKNLLRKYLLVCYFFMEQRCAPLSQSSNKHEAQTPADVQRVTLPLRLWRCHSLPVSLSVLFDWRTGATGQVTARLCTRIMRIFFLFLYQKLTFIHLHSYRAKTEALIHSSCNIIIIIINNEIMEFMLLHEKRNEYIYIYISFFLLKGREVVHTK